MSAMLQGRGLTRVYASNGAELRALDGVDIAIERGEFVALMGPSGSGKSTLLHVLGGLDRPTTGEIELDGERVDGLSETGWATRRRQQLGYVFQFFNLIGNLSAADNVELPGLLAGLSPRQARARREALLEELGIADRARLHPAQLAGGEQQRVAIARALINEPAVLLADEPTGNLDSLSAAEVMELLRRRNAAGQTILLVTHDPRVAVAADRVIRMRDGRIHSEAFLGRDGDQRGRVAELAQAGL